MTFVQELLRRDMITFRGSIKEQVGVFFVLKKSGRLRMVIDARRTNARMVAPPRTRLASTAAVVEYVADKETLYFSAQDIADCYYQFFVPDFLVPFFGLRPVLAGELGLRQVDGQAVHPRQAVYPCLRVLPMGLSWALHWTQEAHRHLLARAGLGGPAGREWLDRAPSPAPTAQQCARVVYVDNEVFVGTSKTLVEEEREQAARHLASIGLPLHEVVAATSSIEVIGLELDGVALTASLSSRRRWRLVAASRALLRRGCASGSELEVLVGHYTHAMLLNRAALCTFGATYTFIHRFPHVVRRLWPSVRQELECATALLPLMQVQWSLPFSRTVWGSDATLRGYAAGAGEWAERDVRSAFAWSDRWRFRLEPSLAPREKALASGLSAEQRRALADSGDPHLEGVLDLVLDPAFPELDRSVVEGCSWDLIQARRYHFSEKIHLKELRAVLFGLKHLCREARRHCHRQLFICDNLAVVLSLEKGRACNRRVLHLVRQWGAHVLAAGLRTRVRWVLSELNPLDEPSRWFDTAAEKEARQAHKDELGEVDWLAALRRARRVRRRPADACTPVFLDTLRGGAVAEPDASDEFPSFGRRFWLGRRRGPCCGRDWVEGTLSREQPAH
ncbi:MAG: hypothetical protein FJ315_03970, partial [SAR202 cluster bacterium]|nr:hypothetical protein [SAR202 cluster bacterium]